MGSPEIARPTFYYFDDIAIDCENFRVIKGVEARSLPPRAFDVLIYLVEHRGRVVEKQEMFEAVWDEAFVTDNALTRAVKDIRRAIGDDASSPRFIETIPKRGYRFVAEVRTDNPPQTLVHSGQPRRAGSLTEILHYTILSKLGEGGGGAVYLARDTRLERTVVLKFLSDKLIADENARERFIREARLASSLDHPNICTIHEINDTGDLHFIVMQYVEGKTLKEVLANKSLETSTALAIAIQIADGLAAAHDRKIIHRDIKPGNIAITNNGQVKILDFGLAKSMAYTEGTSSQDAIELTRQGAQLGTPAYMSPEQVRGERADHRSDVFSFGVVLYEMVTGRSPFKAKSKTPFDIMHSVAHDAPRPVSELNHEVPAQLEAIIERMMQKNPSDRYQTTAELLEDLRKLKHDSVSDGAQIRTALSSSRSARRGNIRPYGYIVSVMLLLAVIGVVTLSLLRGSAAHSIGSLVVLPFTNGSADPNSDYLSDGMTESIINSLSQVSKLRVIARTTAFRYKGRDVDPRSAGQELKVQGILTGKVTQQGDSLLVQVELVDAADGTELWGEKYSRKMSDILTVQAEIARQISETLRLRLTGDEATRLAKSYTGNSDAYQLYLRGRYYWNKRTNESYSKSIEYFQQAIAKDPNYALAYSGLADAYSFMANQSVSSPVDAMPKAAAAALRALELDNSLAEAHTSSAYIKLYYDWDLPGAEQEYKRAIELNPRYATPHHGYGYLLISSGKTAEAFAEIEKAEEIDPLSLLINTDHGEFFCFARQPSKAIAQLTKVIDMDPTFVRAHFLLGRAYVQNGQCPEAIAEFQKARDLVENSMEMLAALGQGYAWCGPAEEAKRVLSKLEEFSKQRYVSPHWFGATYAALGDKDKAFDWLNRAFDRRFGPLIYLKVNPIWDNLRTDPRFPELLKRAGLAP